MVPRTFFGNLERKDGRAGKEWDRPGRLIKERGRVGHHQREQLLEGKKKMLRYKAFWYAGGEKSRFWYALGGKQPELENERGRSSS